jgi:Fic family protein
VAHAAIAHARFEVIHPFADGNGRVGQLLIQRLLRRRLVLPSPIPVSVVWAEDPERYVQGLRAYQDGDVGSWLQSFSLDVIRAVGWMTDISERLIALTEEFKTRVDTRGESVTARVIEDLPDYPIVDSQTVAVRYGLTPRSAHASLIRLEAAGILSERAFARRRKGRPRRMFASTELIDLLA